MKIDQSRHPYHIARRVARREAFREGLSSALGTRQALDWSQQEDRPGMPMGTHHPSIAAVMAAHHALSGYRMPMAPQLRALKMERTAGHGAHGMSDGTVTVRARATTLSGVSREFDLPVPVRNGYVLEPVMFIHEGTAYPLTQDTIDALHDRGTFYGQLPSRPTMFHPPASDRTSPQRVPILRRNMFAPRASIRAAVQGRWAVDLSKPSGPEHDYLDPAERPHPEPCAGKTVKTTRAVAVTDRGGQRWHIPKGSAGRVERDMEGDGRWYYVRFEDFAARVPGDALR